MGQQEKPFHLEDESYESVNDPKGLSYAVVTGAHSTGKGLVQG